MPGTIHVSVLEFKGIASSSPPSSVFLKVSLGKTEYQTWDKGDFSFPLTTLRDSLTVTIQDPEGNEISKIGVHSMAIVEKGIWDDLFPLQEGGHVHMKLQFNLNEEERSRIRGMRELALKKKQLEELSKDTRYFNMASDASDSVASSPINNEVSGKESALPYSDTISRNLQSNNGKEEALLQKHIAPNATDNSEESSSSKMSLRTEVQHLPVRKNDTHPHLSQNNSLISGGTESVAKIKPVLLRMEDTPAGKHEKQFPQRKPASSIMKMINAFETTLVQEKKTPIQVPSKSQSNRARKEGLLKDQVVSNVKEPEPNSERPEYLTDLRLEQIGSEEVSSSGRLLSPPQISSEKLRRPTILGKLQQLPPDSMNKGKHIGDIKSSVATRQLIVSSISNAIKVESAEADAIMKIKSESNKDQDHSSTDERSSASKASSVLKQEEKGSVQLQPSDVYAWQEGSEKFSFFKGLKEVKSEYLNEYLGSSNEKQKTVAPHEDEQHQHGSSTAWIFPNDARRMCVTSGVTAVIDSYDGCHTEGKHAVGPEEMKESETDTLNLRNSKPECWADNAFTGSVKHAIKIAIVVGFGALVLFTRQREPRRSNRKAEDPFFSSLPYTGLQTSVEK
ncbi:uncharacterized protein LOC108196938 isoform X2 [Daucus carota subsp. sativus]|uniref:uncharacterized protein LOC108196938 isoform X2 n=1 Tax=Daucus carota subsp. sativus TaxID=79200 RepID=UPI0007EF80A5|nr:PREDICTED: uncharacterized protein LOC108196938 isoform X2 [Daucus carota subsp. sativus]